MITKPEEVMYIIQIDVPQIKHKQAKELINRLVESIAQEDGVLHYQWSIEGDSIESIEHFKDSEATLAHLHNFQEKFAKEYMDLGPVVSTTVYGNPSKEVRDVLDGFGAVYRETIAAI